MTPEKKANGASTGTPAPSSTPWEIQKPSRWDVPFGAQMTKAQVDRVMAIPPFSLMDESKFSRSTSLRDILLNDCRIRRYADGDIVMREGDYGNSACFVLTGSVCVSLDKLPGELLGRRQPVQPGFLHSLAQLWRNPRLPEVRQLDQTGHRASAPTRGVGSRRDEDDQVAIFLQDFPAVLTDNLTVILNSGEWFGEIAALGRTPRTATVVANEPTELLEIRWQGLRDIRARDPGLKAHIDQLYRERSLRTHLRETPLLRHLSEEVLQKLAEETRFETHGKFDWHGSFKTLSELSPVERLKHEPIIAQEGDYPNGLMLIRAGFGRLSQRYNHGERTLSYLGRGQAFGFDEILLGWRTGRTVPFARSLRGVGYVDVLVIPMPVVEELVLPTLTDEMIAALTFGEQAPPRLEATEDSNGHTKPELIEFLVDNRFFNGTAAMVIDLERCTRCDDCVRACAAAHNNNPRFIRHGLQHDGIMVANACMHCADPVCMIGCPTGAIHRTALGGQVVINDDTCIGCATCANSCPYNNIQMVDVRDPLGNFYFDPTTQLPLQKATKCDLCVDQLGGPACARACPHDALARLDLNQFNSLAQWLDR